MRVHFYTNLWVEKLSFVVSALVIIEIIYDLTLILRE